ncbi:hypothetical protein SAMD00019534_009500, partial [Acytostelium subglobosum LB1]|uniref:hypothetical protein n=1 Tax=Acytostelium subglobosum LB1 TaxID=1410327 RepID=UPI000644E017
MTTTTTSLKVGEVALCSLDRLRPTQCAAGMAHVMRKVDELKTLKQSKGNDQVVQFLQAHPAPVVLKNHDIYLIDNHHLCRALYELRGEFFSDLDFKSDTATSTAPRCFVKVVSDLSAMDTESFWKKMDDERWVHPYDHNGKGPVPFNHIPTHIKDLKDDIWRSVAALVKIQGGFKKTMIPYAEFQWANFFRENGNNGGSTCTGDDKQAFQEIVNKSMELAQDKSASHLPGYTG